MNYKIDIGTEIDLQELLQSRLLIQANSGGGKSVIARDIIEESFDKVPFIILDVEGEYYTLKEKFGDLLIIGGQHADAPISLKTAKLLPKEIIGNRVSVIIDLSDLQMSDRILYAKYFLETMMDLPSKYWVNYFVFIEEAHKLCGEQDKQASAAAVKDLMSRGRKRGYCGILITQRISKLHKDAAAECNNKFIGRTFLDIDLDRAAKELGLSGSTDKNIIRNLQPGHFYAFGTAIIPHAVHELKVNLPKTKIPKAGINMEIKPKKPTEKLRAMLSQLINLPTDEKKPIDTSTSGAVKGKDYEPAWRMAVEKNKEFIKTTEELVRQINEKDKFIEWIKKSANEIGKICEKFEGIFPTKKPLAQMDKKTLSTLEKRIDRSSVTNMSPKTITVKLPIQQSQLSKCANAILQFLWSFENKKMSFSKTQIGISIGYSPNSGSFNNSISELNSKAAIVREAGGISLGENAENYVLPEWTDQKYNIENYMQKLGKCEKEIYRVLLDNPNAEHTKAELSELTESKYSPTSGSYNNSISALSSLGILERNSGLIRLNPELGMLIGYF